MSSWIDAIQVERYVALLYTGIMIDAVLSISNSHLKLNIKKYPLNCALKQMKEREG